ncbi:WD40-repeat-containing domain protein, partial [Hygrophoropsis aurantiaca]
GIISSIAFSPDGSLIASASESNGVQLWNSITGANIADLSPPDWAGAPSVDVCFSPSGNYVAVGFSKAITCWDTLTARCLFYDPNPWESSAKFLVFSPNSDLLASTDGVGEVRLWNVAISQPLDSQGLSQYTLGPIAFSSNSRFLVAGGKKELIVIWDVNSSKVEKLLKSHCGSVTSIALSSDDRHVACGSVDGSVGIWNIETAACIHKYSEHQQGINLVRFTPDGKRLISASSDTIGSSTIVEHTSFECICFRPPSFALKMTSIAFSSGQFIFYGELKPFAPSSISSPAFYGKEDIRSIAISPDGGRIARADRNGRIRIQNPALRMNSWDEFLQHEKEGKEEIWDWQESPDESRYLVRHSSGDVLLQDNNGNDIKSFHGDVFASPDWTVFACIKTYWADSVTVWDSKTGVSTSLAANNGRPSPRNGRFSQDNTLLAIFDVSSRGVTVWDTASHRQRLNIRVAANVESLEFSPDSTTLAIGMKGIVQLWDLQHSRLRVQENLSLTQASYPVNVECIAFSPDSPCIACWCSNRYIHFFRLSSPVKSDHILAAEVNPVNLTFLSDGATILCQSAPGYDNMPLHLTVPQEIQMSASRYTSLGGWTQITTCACEYCRIPPNNDLNPHLTWRGDESSIYPKGPGLRMGYFVRDDGWVFCDTKKVLWLPVELKSLLGGELKILSNKRMVVIKRMSRDPVVVELH